MPVKIDGHRFDRLRHGTASNPLQIALINNMPDAAMEDTELQYLELLSTAAESAPIRLKLFSLPNVSRGDRAHQHLADCYLSLDELFNSRFDGAIITGTEPKQRDLRQEPYWHELTEVLEWAERNTTSTVLSCLAAHAGVLHGDGIDRHLLVNKRFGVFGHAKVSDHSLLHILPDSVHMPHSRWNEVREKDLAACGYTVLTRSSEAGVDLFVKQKRNSLFIHFQGHPEYQAETLAKEYRRDVKRFLRGERDTYPMLPVAYFDPETQITLNEFRQTVLSNRCEDKFVEFPTFSDRSVSNVWHTSAARMYQNWINLLIAKQSVGRSILMPVLSQKTPSRRAAKAV